MRELVKILLEQQETKINALNENHAKELKEVNDKFNDIKTEIRTHRNEQGCTCLLQ